MAWRPFRCSAFRRRLFPFFLASRADSCAVEKDDDEGTMKDNDEQVIASLTMLEVIQSALPVLEAAVRGWNVKEALEWGAGEVGREEVVRGVAGLLLLLQQTQLGRVPIGLGLPLVAMAGGGEREIGS
jgi:hypothetical protein